MDSNAIRHFFNYHFAENRKIWDEHITPLSQEQFTREFKYAHGSVRDQLLHIIDVDEAWFSDLLGGNFPADSLDPEDMDNRVKIRARWDDVERIIRDYLKSLQDSMLNEKPLEGEDENLILWQILLHVVNHGTDHRAQLLRTLNDLGLETSSQDYIFFVYNNPK